MSFDMPIFTGELVKGHIIWLIFFVGILYGPIEMIYDFEKNRYNK